MSNAMPPPPARPTYQEGDGHGPTPQQSPTAHRQNQIYVDLNPPPQYTRNKIVEILKSTASNYLSEMGHAPGQNDRVARLFEDNKKLAQMLNEEKRKTAVLQTPHAELVALVVNLQGEVRRLQNQVGFLSAERNTLAVQCHNLSNSSPNGVSYQRLQSAYNDLVAANQNTSARLNQAELQMGALAAHCRRCPGYAQQLRSFEQSPNTRPQHPQGQAAPAQPHHNQTHQQQQQQQQDQQNQHRQQRRASAPTVVSGSSQHPTPLMPIPTTQIGPTLYFPETIHQRSASASHFQPPSSSNPHHLLPNAYGSQNGIPRPSSQTSISTASPLVNQQGTAQQHNRSHSSQMQPNDAPRMGTNHAPSPLQQPPQIFNRPASNAGYFTNVDYDEQSRQQQQSPCHSGTVMQPNENLVKTPVSSLQHAMPAPMSVIPRLPNPNNVQVSHTYQRAGSIISVSSSSRPNSAASTSFRTTPLTQHTPPIHLGTSAPSSHPRSIPATQVSWPSPFHNPPSVFNTLPLVSSPQGSHGFASPPPPSSGSTVDGHAPTNTNADSGQNGISSKRSSAVFEGPLLSTDDSRKKMRMDETSDQAIRQDGTSVPPSPPDRQGGQAMEEDDEDDEDEEIPIGPDGLRLVSDCLSNLFETQGEKRMCRLCTSRFKRGLVEESAPFIGVSDEVLVEHCVTEHDQVWNELRHDI